MHVVKHHNGLFSWRKQNDYMHLNNVGACKNEISQNFCLKHGNELYTPGPCSIMFQMSSRYYKHIFPPSLLLFWRLRAGQSLSWVTHPPPNSETRIQTLYPEILSGTHIMQQFVNTKNIYVPFPSDLIVQGYLNNYFKDFLLVTSMSSRLSFGSMCSQKFLKSEARYSRQQVARFFQVLWHYFKLWKNCSFCTSSFKYCSVRVLASDICSSERPKTFKLN